MRDIINVLRTLKSWQKMTHNKYWYDLLTYCFCSECNIVVVNKIIIILCVFILSYFDCILQALTKVYLSILWIILLLFMFNIYFYHILCMNAYQGRSLYNFTCKTDQISRLSCLWILLHKKFTRNKRFVMWGL